MTDGFEVALKDCVVGAVEADESRVEADVYAREKRESVGVSEGRWKERGLTSFSNVFSEEEGLVGGLGKVFLESIEGGE